MPMPDQGGNVRSPTGAADHRGQLRFTRRILQYVACSSRPGWRKQKIASSNLQQHPETIMKTTFVKQALSLSLAALMTLAVLAGIDFQAQPEAASQQLAQVLAPKA